MNKAALILGIAILVLSVSGIGFATDYYEDDYWEDDYYDDSYYYDSGCCCGSALILSILGFVAIRQ